MTLKEAIEHCEELAKSCEGSLCGEQHAQLAEWLKDYEKVKELPCIVMDKFQELPCIAVDKEGASFIAEKLFPIPPLACKGNANGWTMYDPDDEESCDKIPIKKDLLVQHWDDTVGIDYYVNGWFFEEKPIACWREIK